MTINTNFLRKKKQEKQITRKNISGKYFFLKNKKLHQSGIKIKILAKKSP